jgi:hypothetical protein
LELVNLNSPKRKDATYVPAEIFRKESQKCTDVFSSPSIFKTIEDISSYKLGTEGLKDHYRSSSYFWAMMPCNPLKVDRYFGATYRLHLQGRRISQNRRSVQAALCDIFL